jgi:hypothetical protein
MGIAFAKPGQQTGDHAIGRVEPDPVRVAVADDTMWLRLLVSGSMRKEVGSAAAGV